METCRGRKRSFFVKDGMLFHRDQVLGQKGEQLCLPENRIEEVCRLAHDVFHQGVKQTKEKICYNFYWDGINAVIAEYVSNCHEC